MNFNRIWILHISSYWFYTAFNSPKVYAPANKQFPSAPMTWSATALGGAVATLIMIAATVAEFSYVPTTWNNASHLTARLIFLLIVLALTGGPTVYIAMVDDRLDVWESEQELETAMSVAASIVVRAVTDDFECSFVCGEHASSGTDGNRALDTVCRAETGTMGLVPAARTALDLAPDTSLLFLLATLVIDTVRGGPANRPDWMRNARTYSLLNATSRAMVDYMNRRRTGTLGTSNTTGAP